VGAIATTHLRHFVLVLLASALFATEAAAQAPSLLNELELQRLVANSVPVGNEAE
jgi:hypothetical protein